MQFGQGWLRGVAIVVAGVVSGACAFSQDETIEIELLPHSVVDSLKSKFPKAEMGKAVKKEYVGRTVYQITMTQKRQKLMATVAENGGIVSVTKEIMAPELPDTVTRSIMTRYPGWTISSAQEITEIKYSLTVKTDDPKDGEKVVSIDPAGMIEEEDENN